MTKNHPDIICHVVASKNKPDISIIIFQYLTIGYNIYIILIVAPKDGIFFSILLFKKLILAERRCLALLPPGLGRHLSYSN